MAARLADLQGAELGSENIPNTATEPSPALATAPSQGEKKLPLVFDLDGTLLATDSLHESLLVYLRRNPLGLLYIPFWLAKGRAYLKCRLAHHAQLDATTLPINEDVRTLAVGEKADGRPVWLATAADITIANGVATRCQCFDGVLASDGYTNMKGRTKAERLATLFPSGFAYAGDSRSDLPVWSRASEIIMVNPSAATRIAALKLGKPTQTLAGSSTLPALIRCARPHQWAKNVLVFVPIVLAGELANPTMLLTAMLAFIALCLIASSTYIVNDLWDLADDRRHWSKRRRPIASGQLSIATALAAAPIGIAAGGLLGLLLGPIAALTLLAYVVLTLAYSFWLKRVPVLDVTTLASLFTLRLVLGIMSTGLKASPWLLGFSMLLFSSLCLAKRYVEIVGWAAQGQKAIKSRGYQVEDIPVLVALGLSTGVTSVAIMLLYIVFEASENTFYGHSVWLWGVPLILFFWISRIWLLASRGQLDDDPVAFALKDPPSLALGVGMTALFLLAWIGNAS